MIIIIRNLIILIIACCIFALAELNSDQVVERGYLIRKVRQQEPQPHREWPTLQGDTDSSLQLSLQQLQQIQQQQQSQQSSQSGGGWGQPDEQTVQGGGWGQQPDQQSGSGQQQGGGWGQSGQQTSQQWPFQPGQQQSGSGQQFPSQPSQPQPQQPVVPAQSPALTACLRRCQATSEYNPICGSNGQTYSNMGRLRCASDCLRIPITVEHPGICPPTTTPARFKK